MRTQDILARLVGFASVTDGPNLMLIDWVQDYLTDAGFEVTRVPAPCGTKAGLLARFGAGAGGVLLSGHSDVVPVTGQNWSRDPFVLEARDGRFYGRGSTDMKGFLASVLAFAGTLRDRAPARPVMIAISWDEEIGCRGIGHMIDRVIPVLGRPDLVVVGEPTSMRLCLGHKGKAAYHASCNGTTGHSAMAPQFTNALHLAADLLQALRREQSRQEAGGAREDGYAIPFSTLHAGRMSGGTALNIVPDRASVDFEIRHVAAVTAEELLARVVEGLPEGITVERVNAYPGLAADPDQPEIRRFAALLEDPAPVKVSYGTEAGFFAGLGLPTLVCGPGDMAQGHQPDEFIEAAELARCDALFPRLFGLN